MLVIQGGSNMASVPFVQTGAIAPAALPVRPAWWLKGHTYALAAAALGEVAMTWGMARLVENVMPGPPGWHEVATAATIGFLLAQCFLLGLWAALGGLATVPRWLIVGGLCLLGSLAVAWEAIGRDWSSLLAGAPEIFLYGGMSMSLYAVVLLPLRRLAGWRIDFDAAYHPPRGRRRGQVELMDIAAMMCAVALPLTLGRCLIELGEDAAGIPLLIPIFGLFVLVTAAPMAYAALARRRIWLWRLAAIVWFVAVSWGHSLLATLVEDLDLFDSIHAGWGIDPNTFAFHAAVAASVVLPLAFLRRFGLSLLVVA
jgi:hypothetical protein